MRSIVGRLPALVSAQAAANTASRVSGADRRAVGDSVAGGPADCGLIRLSSTVRRLWTRDYLGERSSTAPPAGFSFVSKNSPYKPPCPSFGHDVR